MKRPFYGWWVTSMGVLGNALQGGFIFWTMGLYTSAFEDHFGAPRAQINLIETCLAVGTNLMSPVVGLLVDRHSPRHLVGLGAVALGLGLVVVSFAGTLLNVWIAFATFMPLAALTLGVLPSAAMISRWFRRRRGLALGLSVTGSSIGGFLVPPIITWMFLTWGWRTGLQVAGVFALLMAPVFLKVLVNEPADLGLEQEEEDPDPRRRLAAIDRKDWKIREILRTGTFWWQTLISGCLLAVTLGFLANLSLHAKDLGITGQPTALLYSLIAMFSFGGKAAMGWLIDRFGFRPIGLATASLMITAMVILYFFKSYPGLVAASIVIGMGFGGVTPLWTNMPARTFGARSMGRALGVMNPLHIPLTAPSAPLAGWISDTTGSYDGMFLIYIGFCLVAATGLVLMRPPRDETEEPT